MEVIAVSHSVTRLVKKGKDECCDYHRDEDSNEKKSEGIEAVREHEEDTERTSRCLLLEKMLSFSQRCITT